MFAGGTIWAFKSWAFSLTRTVAPGAGDLSAQLRVKTCWPKQAKAVGLFRSECPGRGPGFHSLASWQPAVKSASGSFCEGAPFWGWLIGKTK